MSFIEKYCYWSPGRYGIQILGPKNLEVLREETRPFTIRHTKKEVLQQLPDKYYRKVVLEMGPDQRETYRQMEEELLALLDEGEPIYATSVLAKLLRLRQINLEPHILGISNSSSSKTEFIEDLIEDMSDKLVIFSCFVTYISYLSNRIKTPHVFITGKVPVEERSSLVKKFQEDSSIKLCLGTVQTMGEGLTLTAASSVVFADRWWNPAQNLQAEDRLHRIGQKSSVQVIIPVNSDSIDESLDRILEAKSALSSAYLGDSAMIREILDDLRSGLGR
jgi:SNF2 family DNA or RNA helicase